MKKLRLVVALCLALCACSAPAAREDLAAADTPEAPILTAEETLESLRKRKGWIPWVKET